MQTGVTLIRGELPRGEVLVDALWALLQPTGCLAGSAEISWGTLGHLPYVYPALATSGCRAATFSETCHSVGESLLLGGAVTIGRRHGARFAHTHATWLDRNGKLLGGHLLPSAQIGNVPVQVTLRAQHAVELLSDDDPETQMPTFTPHPRSDAASCEHDGVRRAVMSRVRPGVDLHDAVERVCNRADWRNAVVRASLGSVVGARIVQGDKILTEVDGPATECTQLVGTAHRIGTPDADVHLAGTVVDLRGRVHQGTLLRGHNPVAVTFELYVEEVSADG